MVRISSQPVDVEAEAAPVTRADMEEAVDKALTEARDLKKDILTSFGIFAALLVFASLEVQVLANVKRFSLMIGMSAFFLASMLLFVLSLHNIMTGKNEWRDYNKPVFAMLLLLLSFSWVCFAYALLTR